MEEHNLDHIPKKWLAMAELEALHPELTQQEVADQLRMHKKTVYNLHHNERYMELYHQACERHFRSLEALAIKGLEQAIKKNKVDACTYVLNYKGFKPADNVNISSGEININISDD